MKTKIKIIIAGLLLAAFSTPVVQAQTEQQSQQEQVQKEISDQELEKFARVFQELRMKSSDVQQKMGEAIQQEGMEIQRFNQIYEARNDPAVQLETTTEEDEQFRRISSQLEKMQKSFEEDKKEAIAREGMTEERFEKIARQLETDEALQQRLSALFQDQ